MTMQFPDIFRDFFEQEGGGRRSAFLSRIPQQPGFGNLQDFASLFGPTEDRFLAALGSQIRSRQAPTLRFDDFLQSFDFPRMLRRDQGTNKSGLTSPTRFLF